MKKEFPCYDVITNKYVCCILSATDKIYGLRVFTNDSWDITKVASFVSLQYRLADGVRP